MITDSFTDREIEAERGLRSLTRAPWLMSGRVRNPCNLAPEYIRSITVLYEPKHLGDAAA